jgi:hypothetical protein
MSVIVVTEDPAVVVSQGVADLTMVSPVSANPSDYLKLANRPTIGTAAALDAGTAANNVVQLDGSGRLPAVDGSQVTNLAMQLRAGVGAKLSFVNGTTISLGAVRGNLVQIAGLLYQIPSTGVSITNSGLAVSTLYYAYVYMNGATMALELSTTAHVTSAVANNVGIEIKSGDETRTLVGMVYTTAAGQFSQYQVRSWLNDHGVSVAQSATGTVNTTSTSMVELDTALRASILMWAGEYYDASVSSVLYNNTTGQAASIVLSLNGSAAGVTGAITNANGGFAYSAATGYAGAAGADGLNVFSMLGAASANTATFTSKSVRVSTRR